MPSEPEVIHVTLSAGTVATYLAAFGGAVVTTVGGGLRWFFNRLDAQEERHAKEIVSLVDKFTATRGLDAVQVREEWARTEAMQERYYEVNDRAISVLEGVKVSLDAIVAQHNGHTFRPDRPGRGGARATKPE